MSVDMVVQITSLSLLLLVPLMLWGTRPSWWTVAGCLMYPASVLIANAFHVADYVLDPLPPEYVEPWKILPEPYAEQLKEHLSAKPPSAYGFAIRIFTASGLLLVAVYSIMVFFALRADLQARLVWLVVAIGEAFALFEYAECKILEDPFGSNDLHLSQIWGIEVSRYACGRAIASWAPFMPPIITSLYLVWINSRRKFR